MESRFQPLRLHGYPVSNWFNCVRAAMIEKGLSGHFEQSFASQEVTFLASSPMGKIPWAETDDGPIAETVAILDYLDEVVPRPSLRPTDPYRRAKMREALSIIQLYLEAPIRELYPQVFMNRSGCCDPLAVQAMADRALRALQQMGSFRPYYFGAGLSHVDLALFYTLELGERVAFRLFDKPLLAGRPRMEAWRHSMRERESTAIVLADFAPAFADYLSAKGANWNENAYLEKALRHA